MKNKKFFGTLLTAIFAAVIAVVAYAAFLQPDRSVVAVEQKPSMQFMSLPAMEDGQITDFTYAAEKAVHAVVHVKTKAMRDSYAYNPFYEFFFGEKGQQSQPQPLMGFGSGVIISEDGYIITNNHVIDEMDEIEVVLNDRRSFPAKVIGADASTDLALLKIDLQGLPYLTYGNSDDLKLGEWVLAVGNPYNLTSTVTAGIVSAKARNLNILRGQQFAIESFIQTDAAVNPGNSGGALVDISGNLIGVNTAIASRTGAYSGNSFAVPVSIVKKVIGDLMEFGVVQRALIGVEITDVTQELADKNNIKEVNGVYVTRVTDEGAAKDAGMKEGDVIISVNNMPVNTVSELQDQIIRYRPKDKVNVLVKRDNKEKLFEVTLRNRNGDTNLVKKNETLMLLGASFEDLTSNDKKNLKINSGVKIVSLNAGKLMKAGVREGFIITEINNKKIVSVQELKDIINKTEGGVYIEGVYPDGTVAYYAFGM